MRDKAGKDINGDLRSAIDGSQDDARVDTDESLQVDDGTTKDSDDLVRRASDSLNRGVRSSDES